MKACVLQGRAKVETNPLQYRDVPVPEPGEGELVVRVDACGVCRTDLHVVEGELPPRKSPVIPGHQVVGTVHKLGKNAQRFAIGTRKLRPCFARELSDFARCGSRTSNPEQD